MGEAAVPFKKQSVPNPAARKKVGGKSSKSNLERLFPTL
jgi:hypothetical protein